MFPESTGLDDSQNFITIPRHPSELLTLLPELTGKTFVTVSEHLILMFLKEIRDGRLVPNDLRIYCVDSTDFDHNHLPGRRIMVDAEGEMDDWPGGFFRERAGLLF
jgi:predicted ATPase